MIKLSQLSRILSSTVVNKNAFPSTISPNPQQKYSAVAIIIRYPHNSPKHESEDKIISIEQIKNELDSLLDAQILFLERGTDRKAYSGDVCYPGGKVEKGQTPYQAAVRQTFEQTGISLEQKQLLGVVNHKFNAIFMKQHKLVTFVYIFVLSQPKEIKLNKKEMNDYKWISIRHLFDESILSTQPSEHVFSKDGLNFEDLHANVAYVEWPSIELGFKKSLYGLSLYMLGYVLNKIIPEMIKVYMKMWNNEASILQNKSNQEKRIYFDFKRSIENSIISAIRIKNLYFKGGKLNFYQKSALSEEQKKQYQKKFQEILSHYRPEGPSY